MRAAVIFPGQGSQAPGMGAPWRDHPAWEIVERAETAYGAPLAPLILDATVEDLGRTNEAQLAVLLTSLLAWEAVRERLGSPVAFAGHSLGQVTALIASGSLSLEKGLYFAARRADLTQQAANKNPGKMAALLGASIEQAETACQSAANDCWVANDNAPGQVVIAGTVEGVAAASERAQELGVRRVSMLNVDGAFHTPLMDEAAIALTEELSAVEFLPPSSPIITNDEAEARTDGWQIRLAEHVRRPVRWRESIINMAESGTDTFVELGYGGTLAGIGKRISPKVPVYSISDPESCEKFFAEREGENI